METGENNQKISLVSSSFNSKNTGSYHISIEISRNHISYCLLNIKELQYEVIRSWTYKNEDLENIILILNKEEFLNSEFSSSSISFTNFSSTIIPKKLYEQKDAIKMLAFEHENNDYIKHEYIKSIDSYITYSIPKKLSDIILNIFPDIIEYNTTKILISKLMDQDNEDKETAFLNICNNQLEIIIRNKTQLILQNTFLISSPEDLLYYTLFCFEQVSMSTEKIHVILLGDITKHDKYYNILYNYIRNIKIGSLPKNVLINKDIDHKEMHQYFALLTQISCV